MIAVQGSIQARSYEDKQGIKRKAVEIVADNVSFCGSKSESGTGPRNDYAAPGSGTRSGLCNRQYGRLRGNPGR